MVRRNLRQPSELIQQSRIDLPAVTKLITDVADQLSAAAVGQLQDAAKPVTPAANAEGSLARGVGAA
jgi:hypothetical protein